MEIVGISTLRCVRRVMFALTDLDCLRPKGACAPPGQVQQRSHQRGDDAPPLSGRSRLASMSASCDGAGQCCSLRRGDDAAPQFLDRLWGASDRHTAGFAGTLPVPHPPQHGRRRRRGLDGVVLDGQVRPRHPRGRTAAIFSRTRCRNVSAGGISDSGDPSPYPSVPRCGPTLNRPIGSTV
jgi:hypothetical protein